MDDALNLALTIMPTVADAQEPETFDQDSRSSHDSDEGASKTDVDVHFDDQPLTQMLPEDFLLDLNEDGEVFKWLADFAQQPKVTPPLPTFPPLLHSDEMGDLEGEEYPECNDTFTSAASGV